MAPFISKALIDYLQKVFPNQLPTEPPCEGQLGILIGQQKVISHLVHEYNLQNRPQKPPNQD